MARPWRRARRSRRAREDVDAADHRVHTHLTLLLIHAVQVYLAVAFREHRWPWRSGVGLHAQRLKSEHRLVDVCLGLGGPRLRRDVLARPAHRSAPVRAHILQRGLGLDAPQGLGMLPSAAARLVAQAEDFAELALELWPVLPKDVEGKREKVRRRDLTQVRAVVGLVKDLAVWDHQTPAQRHEERRQAEVPCPRQRRAAVAGRRPARH